MDIHKPKPIRNWREFLKEYAIIVIGVLTALAAEQAVEWLHWQSQYEQARGSLASELAGNAARGAYRVAAFDCVEANLDKAAAILDDASRTGTLPPVAIFTHAIPRNWPRGAWDSVVGAQVAAYFPRAQLALFGQIYAEITSASEAESQEHLSLAELNTMVGPGRRLDPASEAELRKALSKARMYNSIISANGGLLAQRVFKLDLPFSQADRKLVSDFIAQGRDCRRSDTVIPAHYGVSAYPVAQRVHNWQKYQPYTDKAPP